MDVIGHFLSVLVRERFAYPGAVQAPGLLRGTDPNPKLREGSLRVIAAMLHEVGAQSRLDRIAWSRLPMGHDPDHLHHLLHYLLRVLKRAGFLFP